MIFYDFEVFKEDWLAVFIDVTKKKEYVIINNPDELKALYEANSKDIWVGYNNRHYDQYIFKGIIFPLSVIQKILIGCSYRVSSTETPPFLLVIIVGIRTVLVGVSLYWVLVGMMACLPVLSIGIWMVLLLIVIGISAVGWCIEKR